MPFFYIDMKRLVVCFVLIITISGCDEKGSDNKMNQSQRYEDLIFEELTVSNDVVYGESIDQNEVNISLKMDIYEPLDDDLESRPLVVLAHGGAFITGKKEDMDFLARNLARAGFVVASISYRLLQPPDASGHSKDVILQAVMEAVYDMKASVRFLRKEAQTYGIDTDGIFIGGYSAGAITALHYAYLNTEEEVSQTDSDTLMEYIDTNGGFEGNSGNNGFSSQINGVINISGALFDADFVNAGEPIIYSIHGTDDTVVPFFEGASGGTVVITQGSGLIHPVADTENVINKLRAIEGGNHNAILSCFICLSEIRNFIADHL